MTSLSQTLSTGSPTFVWNLCSSLHPQCQYHMQATRVVFLLENDYNFATALPTTARPHSPLHCSQNDVSKDNMIVPLPSFSLSRNLLLPFHLTAAFLPWDFITHFCLYPVLFLPLPTCWNVLSEILQVSFYLRPFVCLIHLDPLLPSWPTDFYSLFRPQLKYHPSWFPAAGCTPHYRALYSPSH